MEKKTIVKKFLGLMEKSKKKGLSKKAEQELINLAKKLKAKKRQLKEIKQLIQRNKLSLR